MRGIAWTDDGRRLAVGEVGREALPTASSARTVRYPTRLNTDSTVPFRYSFANLVLCLTATRTAPRLT